MNLIKMFFLWILLSITVLLKGQIIFYGQVLDIDSGESLVGATIVESKSNEGVYTNTNGYFKLSLPSYDSIDIAISYVGYNTQVFSFLSNDTVPSFNRILLETSGTELAEVEIIASKNVNEINNTGGSTVFLRPTEISVLPALLGDVDPMRSFQLMPGISSGNEGTSGLLVRGGSSDQNLYLLDNVPIYNVNHIGGFLSIFDNDAIKSMQVIKGGFPARYGGRISSVVDVQLKEGSQDSTHHSLTIGTISSKYSMSGSIYSKTTYNISIRRSILDVFTGYIPQLFGTDFVGGYTIFDGTLKLTYNINDKSKLNLSFYKGSDHFLSRGLYNPGEQNQGVPYEVKSASDIKWGNTLGVVKWQKQISSRWFREISFSYAGFDYLNSSEVNKSTLEPEKTILEFENSFKSSIKDFSVRVIYEMSFVKTNNLLRFGGQAKSLLLNPNLSSFFKEGESITSLDTTLSSGKQRPKEYFLYAEYQFRLFNRLKGNAGIHSSLFTTGEKKYFSFQPRLSFSYGFTPSFDVKASFSTMQQNLHLLSNSGIGLPTDLWVASTDMIPPQKSWQVNLGIHKFFSHNNLDLEMDTYFKKFDDLIAFSEGASFFTGNADWQGKVENGGEGIAYGLEILLRKSSGKNTGWIGYTLSWNNRKFPGINDGYTFPFRYDRRHDISFVYMRKISKSISLSGSWVFQSGSAITLSTQQFKTYNLGLEKEYLLPDSFHFLAGYDFQSTHYYGERNNFRAPSYHRLDVNLRFEKQKDKGVRIWNIGAYNLYSRLNPYYLYFDEDEAGNTGLYSFSLFPILPSISFQRIW